MTHGHPEAPPWQVVAGVLSDDEQAQVLALNTKCANFDAVAPFSEHPLLNLNNDSGQINHLRVLSDIENPGDIVVIGYCQIDHTLNGASGELAVDPRFRKRGVGAALLEAAESVVAVPQFRVWAHGDLSASRRFAIGHGYQPIRELRLLATPLPATPLPSPAPPPGYTLRTFRPGHDDAAWVALNAAIFADHPEQGRITVADLKRRQSEPWFNAGEFFLLQTESGQTIGYCWLKLATIETGEIYVIAVHSDHRRRGLATYLLTVAFAHLAAAGANEVMLYVEGDDAAALATYHKLGFTQRALDIQYAKVGS